MAAVDRYSQVILEQWNLHHSQELPGPLPQLKKLKIKMEESQVATPVKVKVKYDPLLTN